MSKSILVIDTPENCIECHFFAERLCGNGRCTLNQDTSNVILDVIKPRWCPIRDLPEKKPKAEYQGNGCFGINEAMKNSFDMGFNSCIDEILKGANGNE